MFYRCREKIKAIKKLPRFPLIIIIFDQEIIYRIEEVVKRFFGYLDIATPLSPNNQDYFSINPSGMRLSIVV